MNRIVLIISTLFLFILGCTTPKQEENSPFLVGKWYQDSTNRELHINEHKTSNLFEFKENHQLVNHILNLRRNRVYQYLFEYQLISDSVIFIDYKIPREMYTPKNFGNYRLKKMGSDTLVLIAQFKTSFSPYVDSIIYLSRKLDLEKFKPREFNAILDNKELDLNKLVGYWRHDSTESTNSTKIEKNKFLHFDRIESNGGHLNYIWTGNNAEVRSFPFEVLNQNFILKNDTTPIRILSDSFFAFGIDNSKQFEVMYYSKIDSSQIPFKAGL